MAFVWTAAILFGAVVPAVVAAAIVLLGRRVGGRDSSASRGWLAALGVAAGYVSGHVLLADWPSLPPREAMQWLPFAAVAAGLLGIWESRALRGGRTSARLLVVVKALLTIALIWAWSASARENQWTQREAMLWLYGLIVATLAFSLLVELCMVLLRPVWLLGVLILIALGGTAALALPGDSVTLAQLQGVVAAAMGGLLIITWRQSDREFIRPAAPVIALLMSLQWLTGCFYADLPLRLTAGLFASPLLIVGAVGIRRVLFRSRASAPMGPLPMQDRRSGGAAPSAESGTRDADC